MGLIRAAKGAAGGVFGDQWKEYFLLWIHVFGYTCIKIPQKKLHGVPQTDTGLKISSATVP